MAVERPDLLLVSFYFRPDLSAGSFRAAALVEALHRLRPELRIHVLTTRPNRYRSYAADAPEFEQRGNLTIERIPLPAHRSGMGDQARAFTRFALEVRARTRTARPRLVLATSSRLMTAALGAAVARRSGAALILDIRDIFVDTIGDVLRGPLRLPMLPALSAVERWSVRRASLVNLVSKGFEPWFRSRYPACRLTFFPNGVDQEFLAAPPAPRPADGRLRIVYAGNLGEGQGLEHIVPALASRLGSDVQFRIIGDGGRRTQLAAALAAKGVTTVELVDPMPREALIREYAHADVLFLHLNDYDAFTKVLPSKLFEYAAAQRPILAGVAGYAATFVRTELQNAEVFAPCDVDAAVRALANLQLVETPRTAFIQRFARESIMREFSSAILQVMDSDAARA